MKTTEEIEAFRPRFRPDPSFLRWFAIVNAAVPITLLAIDAARHDLGANGVNYAIHTTGIVALVCFTLSLAITPLRRLTGWSAIVAMRRALGLYGFGYLVIHFSIFFVFDREGSVSSLVTEIFSRRYLFFGTLAFLFFLPLAVTSTDGMISRLGPRRWKRLHRLTYFATSLGALHYILLVKSDLRQPVAFAGVIALLLASRILLRKKKGAARKTWSGELVVARVSEETHDVRTFRLTAPGGSAPPFEHQPGQYLNLALEIDGKRVNRSYTISSPASERSYVEITVKRAADGYASRHLHETIKDGAVLRVTAPAGRFVFDGGAGEHVLLIAGGVGITPLMAIVRTLTARAWNGRIDLVYSARTPGDLVFGAELKELTTRFPNLRVHTTFTREGPRRPIDAALLKSIIPDVCPLPIYLCGPDPMMAAVRSALRELGATNVMTEAFVSPRGEPAAQEEDVGAVADGPRTVQFASTGETAELTDEQTVLEAAEDAGVDIPSDCRTGICGQCKTPLLRGRVVMENQGALTENDRKKRLILACQARPVGAVVVDA